MMLTVRDACEVHDHVRREDTAPEIDDLIDALAAAAASSEAASQFFATNHITGGMRLLLELGFRRLAAKGEQPSFVLSQAMGGGKTQSLVWTAPSTQGRFDAWRRGRVRSCVRPVCAAHGRWP